VARGIAEVILGEQDLCDGAAEAIEGAVIERHEPRLADGGAGLNLRDVGGPMRQAEPLHAETNGAGTDDEDFEAIGAESGDLLHQTAEQAEGHAAIAAHDDVGSEFDDDAAERGHLPASLREWHSLNRTKLSGRRV
jgi:hypothetical protein